LTPAPGIVFISLQKKHAKNPTAHERPRSKTADSSESIGCPAFETHCQRALDEASSRGAIEIYDERATPEANGQHTALETYGKRAVDEANRQPAAIKAHRKCASNEAHGSAQTLKANWQCATDEAACAATYLTTRCGQATHTWSGAIPKAFTYSATAPDCECAGIQANWHRFAPP